MRFDPEYVSQVLNDNFEDAKTQFLSPLVALHYAHLVMLAERGIVSATDARAESMSSGSASTTGPGRPVRAMWNASFSAGAISDAFSTSVLCLVTGSVMPVMSAS